MNVFGIDLVVDNLIPQSAFLLFASLAILGSIMMITRTNAVHSALWLVVVFFQIAGIYVLLNAPFLAALQVLVYTGAILVLFLFVIMLLQLREGPQLAGTHQVQKVISWPIGLLLAVELCALILLSRTLTTPPIAPDPAFSNPGAYAPNGVAWTMQNTEAWGGSSRALGIELYTSFLLPFEAASLILLVAVVGAILLAGRAEIGEAVRQAPSIGINLGRRGMFGTPQAEQFNREVLPELNGNPAPGGQPYSNGDNPTDAEKPEREAAVR